MDSHNKIRKEIKRNNNYKKPQMGDILLWDDNKKDWVASDKMKIIDQSVNVLRNKQIIISNDILNEKIKEQELKINTLSKNIDKILKMLYNNI